jgi:hypothetical protein
MIFDRACMVHPCPMISGKARRTRDRIRLKEPQLLGKRIIGNALLETEKSALRQFPAG